ncbi:mitochondrial carrier [Xylaria sp. FL1777]|nr:mitochondrial carrier [Xylaria sp. FL1777]
MAREESLEPSYLQSLATVAISDGFWAGWISGALGVMAGNSLDRRKVLLQAQQPSQPLPTKPALSRPYRPSPPLVSLSLRLPGYFQAKSPLAGAGAPSLGYGALNALLFVTYNRTEDALNRALLPSAPRNLSGSSPSDVCNTTGSNLWTTWLAGAAGGLATFLVSTPTELIKCKAQIASVPGTRAYNQLALAPSLTPSTSSATTPASSWHIAKTILRAEGIRGLYHGGTVTALRDSIGYAFYFWAFALGDRIMTSFLSQKPGNVASSVDISGTGSNGNSPSSGPSLAQEAIKVVLCGGISGVVSWASVFPLDFVKTNVQIQVSSTAMPYPRGSIPRRKGAMQIAKELYIERGSRAFFRGLAVCSVRAFFVNAFQWPVYKGALFWLGQNNHDRREE